MSWCTWGPYGAGRRTLSGQASRDLEGSHMEARSGAGVEKRHPIKGERYPPLYINPEQWAAGRPGIKCRGAELGVMGQELGRG